MGDEQIVKNKTNLVCNIVDNDDAMCTAVIAGRNCAKPLLTRCVPLHQQNKSIRYRLEHNSTTT